MKKCWLRLREAETWGRSEGRRREQGQCWLRLGRAEAWGCGEGRRRRQGQEVGASAIFCYGGLKLDLLLLCEASCGRLVAEEAAKAAAPPLREPFAAGVLPLMEGAAVL